jgi:hypothetical protein
MSWFKSKEEQLRDNLYDEQVHAQVAGEIAGNNIWPGLWAKAFAEAQGNDVKARAAYINLRVKQIKLGVDAETEMVNRVERLLTANSQNQTTTPVQPVTPLKPEFSTLSYQAQREAISRLEAFCNVCGSNNLRAGRSSTEEAHFCINCGKYRHNSNIQLYPNRHVGTVS